MVNYSKLKAEINNDPLIRGYASMTDQQIADSLTQTIDRTIVESKTLGALGIMREVGPTAGAAILDKLEAAAATDSRLKWFMKELTTNGVDIGNPVTRATIDSLVSAGVITAAEGVSLKEIPEKAGSRAEELAIGKIYARDVTLTRTL